MRRKPTGLDLDAGKLPRPPENYKLNSDKSDKLPEVTLWLGGSKGGTRPRMNLLIYPKMMKLMTKQKMKGPESLG